MILFKPLSNSALPLLAMSPPTIQMVGMATRHGIPPVHDLASPSLSDHYLLVRIPLTTHKPDLSLDMPARQTSTRVKGPKHPALGSGEGSLGVWKAAWWFVAVIAAELRLLETRHSTLVNDGDVSFPYFAKPLSTSFSRAFESQNNRLRHPRGASNVQFPITPISASQSFRHLPFSLFYLAPVASNL